LAAFLGTSAFHPLQTFFEGPLQTHCVTQNALDQETRQARPMRLAQGSIGSGASKYDCFAAGELASSGDLEDSRLVTIERLHDGAPPR
jgi:hypothetical protein